MTIDKIAKIGFKQLTHEGYSKPTISSIGYSVAIMLRDVLGDDHAHKPWWQSYLAARDVYPSKALPFEKALRVQQLIVDDRVALIMKAPGEMALRAYDAGLGRKDSAARLTYAVALSLKVNHIGLTEGAVVRFDLQRHIRLALCPFIALWTGRLADGPTRVDQCLITQILDVRGRKVGEASSDVGQGLVES